MKREPSGRLRLRSLTLLTTTTTAAATAVGDSTIAVPCADDADVDIHMFDATSLIIVSPKPSSFCHFHLVFLLDFKNSERPLLTLGILDKSSFYVSPVVVSSPSFMTYSTPIIPHHLYNFRSVSLPFPHYTTPRPRPNTHPLPNKLKNTPTTISSSTPTTSQTSIS